MCKNRKVETEMEKNRRERKLVGREVEGGGRRGREGKEGGRKGKLK